jgi:hypothetical protein
MLVVVVVALLVASRCAAVDMVATDRAALLELLRGHWYIDHRDEAKGRSALFSRVCACRRCEACARSLDAVVCTEKAPQTPNNASSTNATSITMTTTTTTTTTMAASTVNDSSFGVRCDESSGRVVSVHFPHSDLTGQVTPPL